MRFPSADSFNPCFTLASACGFSKSHASDAGTLRNWIGFAVLTHELSRICTNRRTPIFVPIGVHSWAQQEF